MARQPDPTWHDGLRSVRREELGQLSDLLDTVFWPGLVAKYPHMYIPENAHNLRVVVADGRVVSHIGTLRRNASIMGCTVRVASMGGVGTLPEYRGRGYATRLLEDTVRDCRQDNVDFIVVSGYRKMYYRVGCRRVGRDYGYAVETSRAEAFANPSLDIAQAEPRDIPEIAALYRREPVRWMRPLKDFEDALTGFVMNRPARVLTVREQDTLVAYLIVQDAQDADDGRIQVQEFAGDRRSVVGALGPVLRDQQLKALGIHAMGWDTSLQALLDAQGLSSTPQSASGSVTLVNFPQFMDRMRPYFAELVGEAAAGSLVFAERGDQLVFTYGGDEVAAGGPGEAAQLIFGTQNDGVSGCLAGGGATATLLRRIFPIPALWYGVNYV